MKSGQKILAVTFGLILVLVLGRIAIGFINQPDDKTLIMTALKEAQKASKEGKPGGVLDLLSRDLEVNAQEASGFRGEAAKYIRNMKPDVEFQDADPQINGENARLETSAKMKIGMLGISREINIPQVTINLVKEESREWLLIPVKSWKITNIEVSPQAITEFLSGQ